MNSKASRPSRDVLVARVLVLNEGHGGDVDRELVISWMKGFQADARRKVSVHSGKQCP
jgi:hypothetical protein